MSVITRDKVFISTLGVHPQVVTLALDRLMDKGHRFAEACIIHTHGAPEPEREAGGRPTMRAAIERLDAEFTNRHLLNRERGDQRWHAAYRYDLIHHDLAYRRVEITRPDRQPVRDVETPTNAQAAFRTIYNVVRAYKDRRLNIHFSIAGGRKSMSVFGMAAAQLLFESGDCLWHLLSRDEFAQTRDMHDTADLSRLVPIRFLSLPSIAPVVGGLLMYNDPYDAIEAQEAFLQRIDHRRKQRFYDSLDHVDRQILRGVAANQINAEIGQALDEKALSGSRVADRLTAIYRGYMEMLAVSEEEAESLTGDRKRTFLAIEFAPFFIQRGDILKP